jgi:PleD family two-component response regulator
VTISVGVASLVPGVDEASDSLIEAADASLYAAKRHGRNAVVAQGSVKIAAAAG